MLLSTRRIMSTSMSFNLILIQFLALLSALLPLSNAQQKKNPATMLERTNDLKDFKKILRTKTNVLVLFAKGDSLPAIKKWTNVLGNAAERIYGRGTIVFVDCEESEGKKLCKRLKITPDPLILKHYHNGDFNKDYDRRDTLDSVVRFMNDPKGDLPWEEDPTAANIVHIQDATSFHKLMRRDKRPMLLMVYAPWCGHCKRLKPDYAAAAAQLQDQAILCAVDATRPENSAIQAEYNVTGYPTLLFFQGGSYRHLYGGENNKDSIVEWMKNPSPPKPREPPAEEKPWSEEAPEVSHLDDTTFLPFLEESKSALIMFYAPWCGHCKAMKPDYAKAARSIKETADMPPGSVLAAVDATKATKTAADWKIQGYPTVKYFENGEFKFDFTKRTHDEIVEFMKNPAEPPPPPPPEAPWSEQQSEVLHLTADNFRSELKRKKHALVMFYAPWCGHCKAAKPQFEEAAEKMKDEARIVFAAIDCTAHNSICDEYGVEGYPSIKYFSFAKNPQDYSQGRNAPSFVRFMLSMSGTQDKDSGNKIITPTATIDEFWSAPIQSLTPDTVHAKLAQTDVAFVVFFAPWCPHCKEAKDPFQAAAQQSDKLFASLDCSEWPDFCTEQKIDGYPTFRIFDFGELREEYSGDRKTHAFLEAIDRPRPDKSGTQTEQGTAKKIPEKEL